MMLHKLLPDKKIPPQSQGEANARKAMIFFGVAASYIATSKLGFLLSITPQVTVVWPPTGIALAALVLGGMELWPAIFLAAFISNLMAGGQVLTSLVIAGGNTLEACTAAWALHKWGFNKNLKYMWDIFGLLFCAALFSTIISATIGTAALFLSHAPPTAPFDTVWFSWWLGDAGGVLLVAPLLFAWLRPLPYDFKHVWLETILLILFLVSSCVAVFFLDAADNFAPQTFIYFIFPFIIWAAIRTGLRGTTLLIFIAATIAICATAYGTGPFQGKTISSSLTLLQTFMIIVSCTGLFLNIAINEARQAERERSLLVSLVESSDDAIISKTLDGIITTWNMGAEKLFGYKPEEAVGHHISLIIPHERLSEENHITSQLRKGVTIDHFETERVTKSGKKLDISITVSPIRDSKGIIIGASKIGRNITDQKLAKKRLQDAHKFLEDMLNHIPDPIFMKDRQHRWIGGNKAFWELMDGPPEKFIGKSDYDFFPKEEADVFWERDNKVFNSGEVDINEENFTDSQGRRHIFWTKKQAFLNDENEQFLLGVIRDITTIKASEEKLIEYTRQLERSNQELDDFAYIASHDLKEPLRGITLQSNFLLEDYKDKIDPEGEKRIQRLIQLAKRMERLVNDLLYFSRLGRTSLAIQEADPNAIVHEIEQMMSETLAEKNAHISIPRPMPQIICDKPRIREVFRNLITNAVKYNDKPEAKVEIGFLDQVRAPQGLQHDVFYVKDNGRGIDPRHHQEIFRIFKRISTSPQDADSGTGVGLTFVKKIIERHEGQIWLDSEPGKGTTFFFTLRKAK